MLLVPGWLYRPGQWRGLRVEVTLCSAWVPPSTHVLPIILQVMETCYEEMYPCLIPPLGIPAAIISRGWISPSHPAPSENYRQALAQQLLLGWETPHSQLAATLNATKVPGDFPGLAQPCWSRRSLEKLPR